MRDKSPVEIVAVEEDANLRLVNWNQKILDKKKVEYRLRHGEAVLFINVAQDRFRMIVCFYGMAMLLLPPIDPTKKLSIYLEISRYLRQFSKNFEVALGILDRQIETTQQRIKRRQKMAKKIKHKRSK
jgi:hypothetical protein